MDSEAARKPEQRERAREMRAHGCSLREIAAELNLALSTTSQWVRDIPASAARLPPLPPGAAAVTRLPVWRSGELRRCSRCEHLSPVELFNRHSSGRQWWCRPCFRAYFRARGSTHRRQVADAKRRRVTSAREFVLGYLRDHPCVDCGEADPIVLEFDHVDTKLAAISQLVSQGAGVEKVLSEIAQCEVVCVNCHRVRTARRGGWRRLLPSDKIATVRPGQARNLREAYSVLSASGCVDCGTRELTVLEFDHRANKEALVMRLAWAEVSLRRLRDEIGRCEVRCAKCHRRRTAADGGHYRFVAGLSLSSEAPP